MPHNTASQPAHLRGRGRERGSGRDGEREMEERGRADKEDAENEDMENGAREKWPPIPHGRVSYETF